MSEIDDNVCWECSIVTDDIHRHHPVPRSRGGKNTIPLCLECHAKAHHRKKNMSSSALAKEAIAKKVESGERWGSPPFGFTIMKLGYKRTGRLVPNEHYESILLMFELLKEHNQTRAAEILNEQTDYKSWSQVKVSNLKRKWKSRTRLENFRKSIGDEN